MENTTPNLQDLLELGYIQVRSIIEVLGKPKEHVENSIKGYVDKIKTDSNIKLISSEYSAPKEVNNLWTMFVEIEFLIKNIDLLISFCFDYMPSTVELISPTSFRIDGSAFSGLLSDLQGRLHDIDMRVKILRKENEFIKNNFKNILLNYVNVLIASGDIGLDDLSKYTGVGKAELAKFLDTLIAENKIKKNQDMYSLVSING